MDQRILEILVKAIAKTREDLDKEIGNVHNMAVTKGEVEDVVNNSIDLSDLITLENFLPVETAAYDAIKAGSLGTINGESIENGHDINIDMSLYKMVTELPTENILTNKIYVVPTPTEDNETSFAEYIWTGEKWDQLGSHKFTVDLKEYIPSAEADRRYLPKDGSNSSFSISSTGSFSNFGNNGQAFNAVRDLSGNTKYQTSTGSGFPLNAASFGVKDNGTTAFTHKKYDTFNRDTGAYTGAKNTAVLVFSGKSGLLYAKNTGSANDVTDDMYKRVGVIDSPDAAQRVYSAAQVDELIQTLTNKISSLEERLAQLEDK